MPVKTKLEPADIQAAVKEATYLRGPGTLTFCILTLQNGFQVVGKSACIDPANFDETIGRTIAHKDALEQIWQLEGYRLMSELHAETVRQGVG